MIAWVLYAVFFKTHFLAINDKSDGGVKLQPYRFWRRQITTFPLLYAYFYATNFRAKLNE